MNDVSLKDMLFYFLGGQLVENLGNGFRDHRHAPFASACGCCLCSELVTMTTGCSHLYYEESWGGAEVTKIIAKCARGTRFRKPSGARLVERAMK